MGKQTRFYFLVGLTFLVAGGLLVWFLAWLSGTLFQGHTNKYFVRFQDAGGIKAGADVQLAGVNIGRVEDVRLEGTQAKVELQVEDQYKIPTGSRFSIQARLLGGTPTLTVTPPARDPGQYITPGAEVQGAPPEGLLSGALSGEQREQVDELLSATTQLTQNLTDLSTALNSPAVRRELELSAETLRSVRAITRDAAAASETLPRLAGQAETQLASLSLQANQVLANLQTASASGTRLARSAETTAQNVADLTADARAALNENRPALKSLVQSADDAVSAVAGLTTQLGETVADPKLRANLVATTDNLASISQRLDAVASDLQRLSSDPRISADLRETLGNVRETSASVRNLAARVETIRLPGERRRPNPGDPPPAPPPSTSSLLLYQPGLALDSLYDTTQERLRVEADYTLLRPGGTFYRAGLFDVGETNRINLQLGRSASPDLAYRYGLYAGRLGLGLDARTGPLYWRFDLFDPNRLQFNVRARSYLNENTAITGGVESIGKDDRAVLGIQIRN